MRAKGPFTLLVSIGAIIVAVACSLVVSSARAGDDNLPPAGFTALFNGKDLTNWKTEGDTAKHWKVADGVLTYDGKGKSLVTAEDYGDFELWGDWKIEPEGDSGIYLRGNPQVQIWDLKQWPEGSGGLYNNKQNPSKPLRPADYPPGVWNRFHIRIVGDKVTVELNDVLVVDNVTMENYFDRSKPLPATGTIELQHHGSVLEFKNIFIKEL